MTIIWLSMRGIYRYVIIPVSEFLYRNYFSVYKNLYYLYKHVKDRNEIALWKKLIRPGDIVLDIGSNIGFSALLFSKITGKNGSVHCFEPEKRNFNHLRSAVGKTGNIVINNVAVTEKSGMISLFLSRISNIDHRIFEDNTNLVSVPVPSISIDEYVAGKFPVHFVKMDIQGAEYDALSGMRETLMRNREIIIYSEFWPYAWKRRMGITVKKLFDFIKVAGLKIYEIEGSKIQHVTEERLNRKLVSTSYINYSTLVLCRSELLMRLAVKDWFSVQ